MAVGRADMRLVSLLAGLGRRVTLVRENLLATCQAQCWWTLPSKCVRLPTWVVCNLHPCCAAHE